MGARSRVVCLPGAYHCAEDFLSAGFADCVQARRLPIDLAFVDLEMQHLTDRSAVRQLDHDVIGPARAKGCRSLWLMGISLGGFIALDYAACHPAELDGVCLLAPYLGNRMLIEEIARAPNLAAWAATEAERLAEPDEPDAERRVWRFVQQQSRSPQTRDSGMRPTMIYLGFGRDDRFAAAHRSLAAALPARAVDVVNGAHDWATWKTLWENFLDSTWL